MTCIVSYKAHGKVYMMADSAAICDYDITTRLDKKICIKGDMILGFTGSFRGWQLFQYKFKIPKHPDNMNTMEYLTTKFVDGLRECFKQGGFTETTNVHSEKGGYFLMGYRGEVYTIQSDYQVGISDTDYNAIGCGRPYALGSLYSTYDMDDMSIKTKLIDALHAAVEFSAGVRDPFHTLILEDRIEIPRKKARKKSRKKKA